MSESIRPQGLARSMWQHTYASSPNCTPRASSLDVTTRTRPPSRPRKPSFADSQPAVGSSLSLWMGALIPQGTPPFTSLHPPLARPAIIEASTGLSSSPKSNDRGFTSTCIWFRCCINVATPLAVGIAWVHIQYLRQRLCLASAFWVRCSSQSKVPQVSHQIGSNVVSSTSTPWQSWDSSQVW